MPTVWSASRRVRLPGRGGAGAWKRRRRQRRRGSRDVSAPGGVEVGEERLVLLVGRERVLCRRQLVDRLDRTNALSTGEFFGGDEVVIRPVLWVGRCARHAVTSSPVHRPTFVRSRVVAPAGCCDRTAPNRGR